LLDFGQAEERCAEGGELRASLADLRASVAHAGDAAFGVFPHRLASGSPQGPHGRAPLGRPGEGVAHLAQARRLRQPHGTRGLMQENLNREGLCTQHLPPRPCGRQRARGVEWLPTYGCDQDR
jgi:hypothetical protein